jgi:hypothetical protein
MPSTREIPETPYIRVLGGWTIEEREQAHHSPAALSWQGPKYDHKRL